MAVEYVVVPEKLVGKVIGVQGRQIQSYEMHYAVDIRLEKFFDSGDFQRTIKGSKSNALKAKEAIDGIVKKYPQRQNPQVEEITSDQQVEQDESGMNVVDVGGVTAVNNAALQLDPVQSMWQSSLVVIDSFTDGQ